MEPFATPEDLAARWRPLTDAEVDRVWALLGEASRLIRDKAPTIDARIAAGDIDPLSVGDIAVAVVRRVLIGGVPGAESAQSAVGAVSQSYTFSNPMGNLYLTADELSRLAVTSARGKAFSLSTLPADTPTTYTYYY